MDIDKIIDFATLKHQGQFRIGGEAYISHPLAVKDILVAKGIKDNKFVATAILHDILEDTDVTEDDILELTDEDVLSAVKLLTKDKGYEMQSYIKNIKENEIALFVKLADRVHNLRSAVIASMKFKKRYIKETEDYYVSLSKDTIFEEDIKEALENLIRTLEK